MENSTRHSEGKVSIYKVLPSAITIIGMCFGLTSIRMSLDGFYELAVSLILLAAVADGLDGLVARQLNAVSKFGAELDSLTDFLCFGVAPAILLYCMFTNALGSFGWGATLVYVAASCLRLARFNAFQQSSVNPEPDEINAAPEPHPNHEKPKTHFVGVPAPGAALLVLLPVFFTFASSQSTVINHSHPQTLGHIVIALHRGACRFIIQLYLANFHDLINYLYLHADCRCDQGKGQNYLTHPTVINRP